MSHTWHEGDEKKLTFSLRVSSLVVIKSSIISSGKRPPAATIPSACLPTSVLTENQSLSDTCNCQKKKKETDLSAMCCRRRSPVDMVQISYFFERRAARVPLPEHGFPNKSIRRTGLLSVVLFSEVDMLM